VSLQLYYELGHYFFIPEKLLGALSPFIPPFKIGSQIDGRESLKLSSSETNNKKQSKRMLRNLKLISFY
jgi:hypothetical protein